MNIHVWLFVFGMVLGFFLGLSLIILAVLRPQIRRARDPENRMRFARFRRAYRAFWARRRRELREHGTWWSRLRLRCGMMTRLNGYLADSTLLGWKDGCRYIVFILPWFFFYALSVLLVFFSFSALNRYPPGVCLFLQTGACALLAANLSLISPDSEEWAFRSVLCRKNAEERLRKAVEKGAAPWKIWLLKLNLRYISFLYGRFNSFVINHSFLIFFVLFAFLVAEIDFIAELSTSRG